MLVKHLLYTEKFTIDGARQRIDHYRRTGELRVSARRAFEAEMAQEVRSHPRGDSGDSRREDASEEARDQ